MKKILFALALVFLSIFIYNMFPDEHMDASWINYCDRYNVDSLNPTSDQVDDYLDWYVGSVEEERDLIMDGIY